MASLKIEFEKHFADFRKIQNVVQLLNGTFTLHTNGEWINKAVKVFEYNTSLKIEIIEFQAVKLSKNLFNVFKNLN